jgi:general stress protein CsbA
MKFVIIAVIVALVAASVFADYKWRQWMTARRRDRQ